MAGSAPTYDVVQQYRNSTNLDARFALHQRFSTNPYGWMRWVFDQFTLAPNSRILELGCGTGKLWLENLDRIPPTWQLTLSDFSPGMVQAAQQNLAHSGLVLQFEVIDAQSLPFDEAQFDAVMANHMLYYVADKPKAFAEIKRVLKPGGAFYAATVGRLHMKESRELAGQLAPEGMISAAAEVENSFMLESGLVQITPWFPNVILRRYEDALRVTEVEPLVDYIMSAETLREADRGVLQGLVVAEMAIQGGVFSIQKDSGIFIAYKEPP